MSGVARAIAGIIERHGESMTLRLRPAADDSPQADTELAVRAKRYDSAPREGDKDATQRAIVFRISNRAFEAESPAHRPPRPLDDLVAADGDVFVIQSVDTRRDGDRILMHIISATGDA